MDTPATQFVIIGGGLAGCECALALARSGLASTLYEQKPEAFSPARPRQRSAWRTGLFQFLPLQ